MPVKPIVSVQSLAPEALISLLDAELPQTQCGLCGHADGCLPYARAIVEQTEAANLCVPGGQPVADRLAQLLERPPLAVAPSEWPVASDGRPQRVLAVIREEDCIGCTKCIDACPVDAIVGAAKLMHTVLADHCSGCELCLPPCPVDCIDILTDSRPVPTPTEQQQLQQGFRQRFQAKQHRETLRASQPRLTPRLTARLTAAATQLTQTAAQTVQPSPPSATSTKNASHSTDSHAHSAPIADFNDPATLLRQATLRSQLNKLKKQQNVSPSESRQQQIAVLEAELNQR